MSLVYTGSTQVIKQEIDNLLEQGVKISGEYVKTYFLYGTDNNLLISIEKSKKHSSGDKYNIRLHNVGFDKPVDLQPDWKLKNLYTMAKPFFDKKYSFKSIVKLDYTAQDAKKEVDYYTMDANSKDCNMERLVSNLIYNLYKARCPVDVMEKIIYYIDKPNSAHNFPNNFTALNHNNKLSEYKTPRENMWFFSGENYSLGFVPMDEQAQEIFESVKIALQKQKQNVK